MAFGRNGAPTPAERRAMQAAIALFALGPVGAGIAGMVQGPAMVASGLADRSLDSHFRFLSGLLLALGLGFWSTIPSIEKHAARFRGLSAILFAGGLARLISLVVVGAPSWRMSSGLVWALIVLPFLCLWQSRIAGAARSSSER